MGAPSYRICYFRKLRQKGSQGAELVELAFVLPILLSLMIGIFWAARRVQHLSDH